MPVELVVDDPVELGVLLEEAFADEVFVDDEAVLELAAAFLGKAVLLPRPKPMAAASVPLPPMKIALLVSRLVMTNWPSVLSLAVTLALVGRSRLRALRRSATVSVPVDV